MEKNNRCFKAVIHNNKDIQGRGHALSSENSCVFCPLLDNDNDKDNDNNNEEMRQDMSCLMSKFIFQTIESLES